MQIFDQQTLWDQRRIDFFFKEKKIFFTLQISRTRLNLPFVCKLIIAAGKPVC